MGRRMCTPMTIGNDISTCGADDICLRQTISRRCRDDIRRRWRRTLETSTDAELKHRVNTEVIGNLEEIPAFAADGLVEIGRGGIGPDVGSGVLGLPMAGAADRELAVTNEADT